jgi:fructan beta-fructosidase
VVYDVKTQELSCLGNRASLKPNDGKIALHIFVDRTALDIFSKESRVYMPTVVVVPAEDTSLALNVADGEARIDSMVVYELKSAWE